MVSQICAIVPISLYFKSPLAAEVCLQTFFKILVLMAMCIDRRKSQYQAINTAYEYDQQYYSDHGQLPEILDFVFT
jgi:hypothetical protein